jgi:hypothetical protein
MPLSARLERSAGGHSAVTDTSAPNGTVRTPTKSQRSAPTALSLPRYAADGS